MNNPQAVLDELGPLLNVLYSVFERADERAREYLRQQVLEIRGEEEAPLEPYAYSMLVRFNACEMLESAEFNGLGYGFERLAMNGIELNYLGYRIRVWKADEGELPAPGDSQSRQAFFTQELLFPDMPFKKLAVLWESIGDGRIVLILAAPRYDGVPWQAGQSHWEVTVPYPLAEVQAASDNIAMDDFEDLDFVESTGSSSEND